MKLWSAVLFLLVISGCDRAGSSADAVKQKNVPAEKGAAVEIQLLDLDGIQQLVAQKRGRVVVMDGWSTSCPPCMKEFPRLVELQKKYPDDVAAISLSFDYEGIGTPE